MRRLMADRRASISPDDKRQAATAVAERLARIPQLATARTVSGYVALAKRGELDPAAALETFRQRRTVVALPRVSDLVPRLRFHVAPSQGDLRPGPFGLLEPDATCTEVAVDAIDVMLMPGLAFDADGGRLGYGGGYYDEVATRLRATGRGLLVALGYDFQLVEQVPKGERDVAIDCVVTDARVVWCGGAGALAHP